MSFVPSVGPKNCQRFWTKFKFIIMWCTPSPSSPVITTQKNMTVLGCSSVSFHFRHRIMCSNPLVSSKKMMGEILPFLDRYFSYLLSCHLRFTSRPCTTVFEGWRRRTSKDEAEKGKGRDALFYFRPPVKERRREWATGGAGGVEQWKRERGALSNYLLPLSPRFIRQSLLQPP